MARGRGNIFREQCPGKKRYINDLNNIIGQLNAEINTILNPQIQTLQSIETTHISEIINHWKNIILLIIQMYTPLYDESNQRIVNFPTSNNFRKEVVHESFQNELEPITIDLNMNPVELMKDLTSKKKDFEDLMQSMEEKKKEMFSEPVDEGLCNREENEINEKRRRIEDKKKEIVNKKKEIQWRSNYNNQLDKYKNYLKKVHDNLKEMRESQFLKNADNTRDVRHPNLSQEEIARKPVENFEQITYGTQSGIKPKGDAYEALYRDYYQGLLSAYRIIDNHLQPEVDYLKKTELTGIDYSFETVKNENKIIRDQINENRIQYSTDAKFFFYQNDNFMYLKSVNFILFIGFYIFFILFIFVLYLNTTLTFYYKLFILVVIFLYPFFIRPLEKLIWFIMMLIYSFCFGKAYVESDL